MTPQEIYKKKAEAVTAQDKMTMADHYEAIAKMLRQEAGGKKELTGVAYINARKEAGRKKCAAIFNAMGKAKQDEFNKALADGGWKHTVTFGENGMQHFTKPNVQGAKLLIQNGKFKVFAADTMLCDWTDTKYLPGWIDAQKKK